MVKRTFIFLFLAGFLFLGNASNASGESSALSSPPLSDAAEPYLLSPTPLYQMKPSGTEGISLFPEHLSVIEKIFNPTEKVQLFEEELQKAYLLSEQLKKPENKDASLQLQVSLSKLRNLDILRQFGYDSFSLAPTTFAPITDAPVGPDYPLGPGDELVIQIWGMINGNYRVKIGNDGEIFLPKIGSISLSGKSFSEGTDTIKKSVGQYYKDFQISVSLGKLRTIKVFVAGEVKHPGSYEISSFSTLLNALYFSGGPARTGSLRNIKLLRDGKNLGYCDLYRFLLSGDKSQDYRLQSGDVIFVEPIGKIAAIWGNQVKRPGIYEISEETTLKELVTMAGGLLNLGATPQIKVEFLGGTPKEGILEVLSLEKDYSLRGGETVSISSDILGAKKHNTVIVEGGVVKPGTYVIEEGEKISSLLKKTGGFTQDAFLAGAVFTRKSIQEKQQENLTRFIKTQMDMLTNKVLQSGGALNMDAVAKQQEPINLLISKLNLGRININFAKLIDSRQDLALEDGDRLFIPKTPGTVYLVGAINNQGTIAYEPDKSFDWYINRCGGYSPYADKHGIFIIHPDGTADAKISGSHGVRRGDTVIIPEEIRTSRWTLTKEIVELLYQVALPAAAFLQ